MTAEQKAEELHNLIDNHYSSLQDTKNILIEFANFHAKAQLEAILDNIKTKEGWWQDKGNPNGFSYTDIDRESIKNAYPLTNIK